MDIVVSVFNNSVLFETNDTKYVDLMNDFLKKFYTIKGGGFGGTEETETEYAGRVKGFNAFYLVFNQFKHFVHYCKQQGHEIVKPTIHDKRTYEYVTEDYKIRDPWALRDEQPMVASFINTFDKGAVLTPLATGSGKTVVALITLAGRKDRFCILIKTSYIDKWCSDIIKIHNAKPEEIVVIQGFRSLRVLMDRAKDNDLPWKYYVFSLETFRSFISNYEDNIEATAGLYNTTPPEIFPELKIKTMLIDEVHQAYHAVYRAIAYTNVQFILGLSATMIAKDQTEERLYRAIFPTQRVYGNTMKKAYTRFYPVYYDAPDDVMRQLRWFLRTDPKKFYNHSELEKSILRNKKLTRGYMKLIDEQMERYYNKNYMDKDKVLIFIKTKKMADVVVSYMKDKYPDKVVKRFIDKDKLEDMLQGDIIVATDGKAGTAIDIPFLRWVIQTVSIDSLKTNEQNAGRLRYLPDRDVGFIWLINKRIDKHHAHTATRKKLFKFRATAITDQVSAVGLNLV